MKKLDPENVRSVIVDINPPFLYYENVGKEESMLGPNHEELKMKSKKEVFAVKITKAEVADLPEALVALIRLLGRGKQPAALAIAEYEEAHFHLS